MATPGKYDKEKTRSMQKEVDAYRTTDKHNRFTEDGKEVLNPTPISPPLGYTPGLSLIEQVRQSVRQMRHMDDNEPETEDEADDFDIDDDPPIPSRWENDMIPSLKETKAKLKQLEEEERRYADAAAAEAKHRGQQAKEGEEVQE